MSLRKKKDAPEPETATMEAEPKSETTVSDPPVPLVTSKKEKAVEGQISLSIYCKRKGVKSRHIAGMCAFTKLQRATFSEWEKAFKTY